MPLYTYYANKGIAHQLEAHTASRDGAPCVISSGYPAAAADLPCFAVLAADCCLPWLHPRTRSWAVCALQLLLPSLYREQRLAADSGVCCCRSAVHAHAPLGLLSAIIYGAAGGTAVPRQLS